MQDVQHNRIGRSHIGAWSHQPFGNDIASEWADAFDKTKDLSLIEATLDTVLEQGDEYLEGPDAEQAIAAIEVIAKLRGLGTQSDQ
jgi:hypothetical protein